jgi:hypothetical protein
VWSDGSRLENGRVGAGLAWQTRQGSWKTREIPMGIGHEVFDAELVGACTALELALKDRVEGPVTVLLDSLAAIKRLQLRKPSPGQRLVGRAHRAEGQRFSGCRDTTVSKAMRERIKRPSQQPPSPRETTTKRSLSHMPTGLARRLLKPEGNSGSQRP